MASGCRRGASALPRRGPDTRAPNLAKFSAHGPADRQTPGRGPNRTFRALRGQCADDSGRWKSSQLTPYADLIPHPNPDHRDGSFPAWLAVDAARAGYTLEVAVTCLDQLGPIDHSAAHSLKRN